MITLSFVYVLMGLVTGGVAIVNALDRAHPRWINNTIFWGVYSVTFLFGSFFSDFANGILLLVMVAAAAIKGLGRGAETGPSLEAREASSKKWGNKLFIPALAVPLFTLLGTIFLKKVTIGGEPLVDPRQVTQISLAIAILLALIIGMAMLKPPARTPITEARRLLDSVGWAAVLPQTLAALGAVFALAGVGKVVADVAQQWIPLGVPFVAVATYTIGMALFTMLMGNAFAAFPVMTAGIGLPVIVQQFHGDVVVMSAIGMLSGFCGTLMTPMAANFNIVPAVLLELPDQHGVIKVQIPTAIPLLAANTLLMYFLVF